MLVLTRKVGEKIVIADNIVITVSEIIPGKVKIGIEAPREVTVHRQEVAEAIQQSPAAGGTPSTSQGQSRQETFRRRPRV